MRALLLLCALAACSPQPEAPPPASETPAQEALAAMPAWTNARAAGVDFRGLGQEPGWMLDIYRDQIKLIWDYGESSATFPLTEPTYPQEGATLYEAQADGHTLAVTIRRAPCQDVMSGEAYPATVEVVIDGRALTGCGKSV